MEKLKKLLSQRMAQNQDVLLHIESPRGYGMSYSGYCVLRIIESVIKKTAPHIRGD